MIDLNEHILVVLGPTASGKTQLAIQLAHTLNAEIISADSRQVYRNMDIGTGKDLSEYKLDGQTIPYHLIDMVDAGEKYNLAKYMQDFEIACQKIKAKNKNIIVCGGTGLYLQSIILGYNHVLIPENIELRNELLSKEKPELMEILSKLNPNNEYDNSTKKRLIRAIEIEKYKRINPNLEIENVPRKKFIVLGLNPDTDTRREKISKRLMHRLKYQDMIGEVEKLLSVGVSHNDLQYYGLEYKYLSYYILNLLTYEQMHQKLETEIHRYAKRQMTFFRSMEKKGIKINWLPKADDQNRLNFVIERLNTGGFDQ